MCSPLLLLLSARGFSILPWRSSQVLLLSFFPTGLVLGETGSAMKSFLFPSGVVLSAPLLLFYISSSYPQPLSLITILTVSHPLSPVSFSSLVLSQPLSISPSYYTPPFFFLPLSLPLPHSLSLCFADARPFLEDLPPLGCFLPVSTAARPSQQAHCLSAVVFSAFCQPPSYAMHKTHCSLER